MLPAPSFASLPGSDRKKNQKPTNGILWDINLSPQVNIKHCYVSIILDGGCFCKKKRSLKGHDDNDNRKFLWLANVCNLMCVCGWITSISHRLESFRAFVAFLSSFLLLYPAWMCRTDVTFSSEMLCFSFTKLNTSLKASVNTLALRCPQRERNSSQPLGPLMQIVTHFVHPHFLLVCLINQTSNLQNSSKYQNEKKKLTVEGEMRGWRQLELSWIQSSYSEFLCSLRHHHDVEHVLSSKQPFY